MCVCVGVLAGGRGVWECVSEGWGWWCAWHFSVENAVSSLVIPVGIEPRYIYRNRWTASFQQARNSLGLRLLVSVLCTVGVCEVGEGGGCIIVTCTVQ